jgi:hypothetical protein
MSKRQKRLARIRQNPKAVSFQELRQVLEDFSFELRPSGGGSHYFFFAELEDQVWSLVIPLKKPHVKDIYVKKAIAAIDEIIALQAEEEDHEEDETE